MNDFMSQISQYLLQHPDNTISKDIAIDATCVGVRLFDAPLFAFGTVHDSLFAQLKTVVGAHHALPCDWTAKAKTVISLFFPFTKDVISSNRGGAEPSSLWLHARIEGQALIQKVGCYMVEVLCGAGDETVCPILDTRFFAVEKGRDLQFTSNWSERHVAYICGQGTFGLSKGIITQKGMAGRFLSIVTEKAFPLTERRYTELYEYCTCCGACVHACPVQAISMQEGKAHLPCCDYMDTLKEKHAPRYGCGKCQSAVPCAKRIPKKRNIPL